MSGSDHDIAIGEHAFRAGYQQALDDLADKCPIDAGRAAQFMADGWSRYTPPDDLCGGGTAEACTNCDGGDPGDDGLCSPCRNWLAGREP